MRHPLITDESNAIFDPLRIWRRIGRPRPAGENIGNAVAGVVDFAVELPLAIVENVLWRGPAGLFKKELLQSEKLTGYVDFPDSLQTEDLLARVDGNGQSGLRQRFMDQYSDDYSLHRLDLNVTPILEPPYQDRRIMDLDVAVQLSPTVRCTDVYPQTTWVDEGLSVGDRVGLHVSGKYKPLRGLKVMPGAVVMQADHEVEKTRDCFYEITYQTQVPTIEHRALSDGFGWRFRGTFERYIENGTKRLTAILLVPRHIAGLCASVQFRLGTTDSDRRQPVYPADRSLSYASTGSVQVPVEIRRATSIPG